MTHVLLLNIVFFVPATCGASTFAFFVYRFLNSAPPPAPSPPDEGGTAPLPAAGPRDLADSA